MLVFAAGSNSVVTWFDAAANQQQLGGTGEVELTGLSQLCWKNMLIKSRSVENWSTD